MSKVNKTALEVVLNRKRAIFRPRFHTFSTLYHSVSPLQNGFLYSFLCLPPLFPSPSSPHLPLFLSSFHLNSVFLSVTISSYDCFPSLSSFLSTSSHLSLFATLHAPTSLSPVSSLILSHSAHLYLLLLLFSLLFSFFPKILILFTFPMFLTLCPSSRS